MERMSGDLPEIKDNWKKTLGGISLGTKQTASVRQRPYIVVTLPPNPWEEEESK